MLKLEPEGELASLLLEVLQLLRPVGPTVRGPAVSDDWWTGVAYQQLGLAQNEQTFQNEKKKELLNKIEHFIDSANIS